MHDVIIIGAGIAGTLTALKLPKHLSILLIEAGDEVLPITSSSYNECYKLHTGVHYIGDFETAKNCLKKSIEFAREFPQLIAGGDDLSSPWRRGRHFIMSNSLVTTQQARDISLYLQNLYYSLIQDDSKNKVFGEPEDFIRFLGREDYSYVADQIPFIKANGDKENVSVIMGIETAESQIDIYRLKTELQNRIESSSNISLLPANKVSHIGHNPTEFGYIVTASNKAGEVKQYSTSTLINCAWQNSETLDNKIGVYVPDEHRVNRIKVSIKVELPEEIRRMNTCIFSAGPYCSITILPEGTAILTSERTTNIGYFKAGTDCPQNEYELINHKLKLEHEEGQRVALQIREECASYLSNDSKNALLMAPIKELHVGFVKLMNNQQEYNNDAIYAADSVIHARQQNGVEIRDLGYISNSGMKMTYAVGNSKIVSEIVERHFETIKKIEELAQQIKDLIIPMPPMISHHEKNINSILFIKYREKLKQVLTSKEFAIDNTSCCKSLATEITDQLLKLNNVNESILQNTRLLKKNIQEINVRNENTDPVNKLN